MLNIENYNVKNIPYNLSVNLLNKLILTDDMDVIGLIALSVASIEEQPSLQIDYILVNKVYQGKPFRYLIEFTIDLANKLQLEIGLRYIILSPDNDGLKYKYKQVGFSELQENWMYLKL